MINLVKNALKFTKKGYIKILACYDSTNNQLKVHVKDSGKGISAEDTNKLFTQFGKLRRTSEMNSEGIGMGLMICKNLVELNKGTIELHSDGEDQGSCFTFGLHMLLTNKNDENYKVEETFDQQFELAPPVQQSLEDSARELMIEEDTHTSIPKKRGFTLLKNSSKDLAKDIKTIERLNDERSAK